MQKQKILWFQDGVKLRTSENLWGTIDVLNQRLISLVAHPDFEQEIVDPWLCAENLFRQLDLKDFSVLIDLSGFFGERLRQFNPNLSIVDNFRLSRLRMVSSPRLDGVGFLLSTTPEEVQQIKASFDLSLPLIIDDVSWSGRTVIEATKALGIDPRQITCGFLTVNSGDFGENKPGAKQLLEQEGVKVIGGFAVQTPQEDGFHLADFFDHGFLEDRQTFDIMIRIQELREQVELLGESKIKDLLVCSSGKSFSEGLNF